MNIFSMSGSLPEAPGLPAGFDFFDVTTSANAVLLLGFFIPLVTAVITKKMASSQTKSIVTLTLSVILAVTHTLIADDGGWAWRDFGNAFLSAYLPAIGAYYGFWKHSSITDTLKSAPGVIPPGKPSPGPVPVVVDPQKHPVTHTSEQDPSEKGVTLSEGDLWTDPDRPGVVNRWTTGGWVEDNFEASPEKVVVATNPKGEVVAEVLGDGTLTAGQLSVSPVSDPEIAESSSWWQSETDPILNSESLHEGGASPVGVAIPDEFATAPYDSEDGVESAGLALEAEEPEPLEDSPEPVENTLRLDDGAVWLETKDGVVHYRHINGTWTMETD